MEPRILKLKDPIQFGSETIGELRIRVPKAKDIRGLPKDPDTGDILNLAGRLCGQPPTVIDELSIHDVGELMEIVGNFMEPGQATGS